MVQMRVFGRACFLPVLGEPYGKVLEDGQLKPVLEGGQLSVWYYETRLPIDPRTYGKVLAPAVADVMARHGPEHPDTIELISILNSVEHLPPRTEPDAGRVAMGRVEIAAIKRRLSELGEDGIPERSPAAERAAEAVRETWRSFEFQVQTGLALEGLFVRLRRELASTAVAR